MPILTIPLDFETIHNLHWNPDLRMLSLGSKGYGRTTSSTPNPKQVKMFDSFLSFPNTLN